MTDDLEVERDYEVGYGKPPKHTRFQNGHKGRPRGKARPRKKTELSKTEAVSKTVYVTDARGYREPSTLRKVLNYSLATKAAKGDLRAAALVLRELEREQERAGRVSDSSLTVRCNRVMRSLAEASERSSEIFGKIFGKRLSS